MRKLASITLLLLALTACHKNERSSNQEFCGDGYIRWGGDPAADGFGWYFEQEGNPSKAYPLSNLGDPFKKDSTAVRLCLTETGDRFYCNCAVPVNFWYITSIKKTD